MADFTDYRKKVEQQGVEEHRKFINEQMAKARDAPDAAQRSRHLANAVAANGMLLRGMEVGFITGELNYRAIKEISQGIQKTRAFRSLMAERGEQLAQSGNVDALVRDLQAEDRELSEGEQPSRQAIEIVRGIQAKARARTAQPRDYAALAAVHRLSSWKGKALAPDGKMVEVVRRDLNRELDGATLSEETEKVLKDPDFQYIMEHEKPESLNINALRGNGVALEQYAKRAGQLRQREAQQAKAAPDARQKGNEGPAR